MTIAKINNLLFKSSNDFVDDKYIVDSHSLINSIAWFSQMTHDEKLSSNEVSDVLNKLEDFIDQKEFEKAEIVAELQLAYAFYDVLKEKRSKLIASVVFN